MKLITPGNFQTTGATPYQFQILVTLYPMVGTFSMILDLVWPQGDSTNLGTFRNQQSGMA